MRLCGASARWQTRVSCLCKCRERFSFEVIKQLNPDKRNVFLAKRMSFIMRVNLRSKAVCYNTSCVVYLNFSREKFIVTQLVKKFSLSSNQLCLEDPETESYPVPVYSVPHIIHCLSTVHFNIILPSTPFSEAIIQTDFVCVSLTFLCVLCVLHISFSLISLL